MKQWTTALMLAMACVPSAYAAEGIALKTPVAFNEDADIPKAVREECKLETELPASIIDEAKKHGATVTLSADAKTAGPGRVLDLEITDAVADGNAFIGHRKSMSVKGKLYQDGQVVGSFKDRRTSMGGAFGGFKGNCAVLVRTAKAIGEDVGNWLGQPGMDARLGDLE